MSGISPQQTAPASPVIPGLFVSQGKAIQARLQVSFPETLFHFKVLPPRIDVKKWNAITQGNQPFIGLGFNGFKPAQVISNQIKGSTNWTVLAAVRRGNATDLERYYGDAFGIGALTMAEVAATLLNGYGAPGGTVEVTSISNVAADDWGDDAVIMKIDLAIPTTLTLHAEILQPNGLGWFDVMASAWGWKADDGTSATYSSQWNNPNAQSSDS